MESVKLSAVNLSKEELGLLRGDRWYEPWGKEGCFEGFAYRGGSALGEKASKLMDTFCIIAFVACAGIAVFAFTNVPLDMRMPYDGKYNRSGTGIPMQIAMIPCPLVLIGLWRSGRKPDAHQMTKGGRTGLYILGTAMISAYVIGQWVMARGILEAGEYFVG